MKISALALSTLAVLPAAFAAPTPANTRLEARIPIIGDILPGEKITFIDQAASRLDGGNWKVDFRGYVTRPLPDVTSGVNPLITLLYTLAVNKEVRQRLEERLGWFYVAGLPGKQISLELPASANVAGSNKVNLPRTAISGEFESSLNMTVDMAKETDGILDYKADLYFFDKRQIGGRAFFVEPEGYSVISDIDDTIKVTEVNSVTKMLQHTFLLPFTAVPGMANLYNNLNSALSQGKANPSFHYLSNSPWNLFEGLNKFADENKFPEGQFMLRDLAVLDGSFIDFLTKSGPAQKVEPLEQHIAKFPKRKLIFFGDSTQADPEAYGEIARRHPEKVSCIAIRLVTGVDAKEEATENAPARFETAFAGVDRSKWITFSDPAEVDAANLAQGKCQKA